MDLNQLTIEAARSAIQERKTTSMALVESHYERIQKEDSAIGAFLTLTKERAMMQKKGSDARPASTSSALRHTMWVLLVLSGVIAVVAVVFRASLPSSAGRVEASQRVAQAAEFVAFGPTIPNTIALGAPPPGMAWIPGGEFSMGAMDPPATEQVAMATVICTRPSETCTEASRIPSTPSSRATSGNGPW